MNRFILLILVLTLTPVMATAASFDCRKATTNVEKLICADAELSLMDDELTERYQFLRKQNNANANVVTSQRRWLAERNTCSDSSCLQGSYRHRLDELRRAAMGEKPEQIYAEPEEVAEDDAEYSRTLMLKCSYSDYRAFQVERVEIKVNRFRGGDNAKIVVFKRGVNQQEHRLRVNSGEVAECIYPSGNRVRLKVGEGTARAYGQCGGNPEVFGSIWINQRKVVSRAQFAGRCMEDDEDSVDISFSASMGAEASLTKCHTLRRKHREKERAVGESARIEPMSVCVDFPQIKYFPLDEREYPPPGAKPAQVGSIETLLRNGPVCDPVQKELAERFYTFYSQPQQTMLARPDWQDTDAKLPDELNGSRESVFDFDNDGHLDRVFSKDYEQNYMDGTTLLVQPGRAASKLIVGSDPLEKSSVFLPCQMDSSQPAIAHCPPFSQKHDEAGYQMSGAPGGDRVFFRGRYTKVEPFTHGGSTYLGLSSRSEDTMDYVAVVKPLPGRKFQSMCLFRRVPENF